MPGDEHARPACRLHGGPRAARAEQGGGPPQQRRDRRPSRLNLQYPSLEAAGRPRARSPKGGVRGKSELHRAGSRVTPVRREARTSATVTMPAPQGGGVKRGKLEPEQDRIGGRRSCSLSPRVGRTDGWPSMGPMRIGTGTELGLQAALQGPQSSSARQTVVAVQALQMSRASSIVPRGSGCSGPPRRQSTATSAPVRPGRIVTWRTRQRRIRPPRGVGIRPASLICSMAICEHSVAMDDRRAQ